MSWKNIDAVGGLASVTGGLYGIEHVFREDFVASLIGSDVGMTVVGLIALAPLTVKSVQLVEDKV